MGHEHKIELNQAIQSSAMDTGIDNAIPLLIGKNTLVRVYLGKDFLSKVQGSELYTGRLQVNADPDKGGASVQLQSINTVTVDRQSLPGDFEQQQNINLTINFEFNTDHLFPEARELCEKLEVTVQLIELYRNGVLVKNYKSNKFSRSFKKYQPFKVNMVGLRYYDEAGSVYYPDLQHFTNVRESIENLYPISKCVCSHLVVDADPEFTPPFSDVDDADPDWEWYRKVTLVHAQLLALRTLDLDVARVSALGAWYYGMLGYPEDDFFRGAVSGIQRRKTVEAPTVKNPSFDITSCGPVEDAGGLYAAHEIAHCLDLHHPGVGEQTSQDRKFPFIDGQISVDAWPEEALKPILTGSLKTFKAKWSGQEHKLDDELRKTEALASNATLQRYVERFKQRSFQRQPDLKLFYKALQEWKQATLDHGAEHMGYRCGTWKFDAEILSFRSHFDFMSYTSPKWISAYAYKKLFTNIHDFEEVEERPQANAGKDIEYLCIIGVFNEYLGTGSIKYLFNTIEVPRARFDGECRSIRLRFDGEKVNSLHIFHKHREENELGDPVFLRSGVFKAVLEKKKKYVESKELTLEVLRLGALKGDEKCKKVVGSDYKTVDRKVVDPKRTHQRCDCSKQTFALVKSSVEYGASDYFLTVGGDEAADCSYIARACFFDHAAWKKEAKEISFTDWRTIGVNFDRSQALYIDKNHCLLPASSIREIFAKVIENIDGEPFKSIFEFLGDLKKDENRSMDLFGFSLELICQSGLKSEPLFKGLVIEKPHTPGDFYYINSESDEYKAIQTKYGG